MDKLKDWLKGLEYQVLAGDPDMEVSDVVYDSRKAEPHTVFVCMTGSRIDSHDFIPEVYRKGCRAFVVEKDRESLLQDQTLRDLLQEGTEEAPTVIRVENARHALALLSAARFSHPEKKMTVIGLTGTKGKTTTAFLLKSILEHCGKRVGLIGTNGCEIAGVHYETRNTTPESYEISQRFAKMVEAGCEYAVMECSSQGFKMHRTDGIRFDIGMFLNISPDHIGPLEHADFEEYLSCKKQIFRQSEKGILNLDDDRAEEILKEAPCSMYTYGIRKPAQLQAEEIRYIADGSFVGGPPVRYLAPVPSGRIQRIQRPCGPYDLQPAAASGGEGAGSPLPDPCGRKDGDRMEDGPLPGAGGLCPQRGEHGEPAGHPPQLPPETACGPFRLRRKPFQGPEDRHGCGSGQSRGLYDPYGGQLPL